MITATTNFKTALAAFTTKPGKLRVFIQIAGYTRAFSNFDPTGFTWNDSIASHNDWLGELDDITFSVNDLDGGADIQSWGFTVQDVNHLITADMAGFTFEGKLITVKIGFDGLSIDDYCTVFTGFVDSVSSVNSNLDYYFNCIDTAGLLTKVIWTTGNDGQPTSPDHIRTISGHPLDLLLDVLSSQVGLASQYIDTTKIQAYRDGPFAGMKFVFNLQQSQAAGEFIKAQLLKPLGGYLWTDASGKVTVNFFYPIAGPTAVATFGEDTWLSIPSAEQTDMVNTVQVKFDKEDDTPSASGNYLNQTTQQYGPSVVKYGQYGEHVIDSDGMRSSFQGFFIAALTARMIFMRYGYKNLKFDSSAAEALFSTMLVELGDVVAVTHTKIPDRQAGVMGVTGKLFEVLGKTLSLKTGRVTYIMIDASYLNTFGFYLITPDAEADYAAASSLDKAKYMFMTNNPGVYSNGDAGHGLG